MESIVIIEKDKNKDILPVWSYPFVESTTEKILIQKSRLEEIDEENYINNSENNYNQNNQNNSSSFWFSKFKDSWIYANNFVNISSPLLAKVKSFSLIVMTKTFNPEKFNSLTELMGKRYLESGSAPRVLESFLAVMAADKFDFGQNLAKFDGSSFDDRKAFVKASIKGIIGTFGQESILLYCGMMLKKRIGVYSSNADQLLETVRCLPIFAWHRKNWSILRPIVTMSDLELDELSASGVYVAGFMDKSFETRDDLFDLLVDVDSRTITVTANAKNDFILGKPHKDLAALLVSANEENAQDQQVIRIIATQTKEFLDKIESLIGEGQKGVTVEAIKGSEQSSSVARFLWNLAIAEEKAEY